VEASRRAAPIRSAGLAFGERDGERAALPGDALNAHRAAVELDQFLNQRQADARAFVGPRPRPLNPMEALEDVRHVLRGDARAGVPHRQFNDRDSGG
jgi:hypothetical protein